MLMYILVHIMYTRLYSGESVSTHVYMHASLYMFNAYSAYVYTVHIVHTVYRRSTVCNQS